MLLIKHKYCEHPRNWDSDTFTQCIKLEDSAVSVNQGLVRTKQGLVFQTPKAEQGKRTILIPNHVADVLKFHQKRQENIKEDAGSVWIEALAFLNKDKPEENCLVFTNKIGQLLEPRVLTRHFEILLKKAGLPKIRFHGLRHTFATLILQQNVDMRTTSEKLVHYDLGFTLSAYSGATAKMRQEATDKIGNLFSDC